MELRDGARFDSWVAAQLQNVESDIFIGDEMSCLESFRAAKKLGMRCVLDHAATHWRWQDAVMQQGYEDAAVAQYSLPNSLVEKQKRKEQELELADVILTPSQLAKDTLVENGVPQGKIKLLPYGVDLDLFRPDTQSHKKDSHKEETFCLVFVGSVRLLKGLHYLISALEGVPGCKLKIVGSLSESVAALAASKRVAIEHIPQVSHVELVTYITSSDLLVLPSIADSFGLVVLEAMACGVPVLVTEHVGAKDVVREKVDGFVVPAMNVEALRAAVEYGMNHREALSEMGQEAEKQAQQYSWQGYYQRLQALLREV